jgi:4-hydroxythreonine-4-phosphate dehydrogenase
MSEEQRKPLIGITLGDYNGVGPEIILKAVQGHQLNNFCTPVIYGSTRVLNRYRQILQMKELQLFGAQSIDQINRKQLNVINCWSDNQTDIEPGKVTKAAGQAAYAALKTAVGDLKAGKIDALVTAPINKDNIQSPEFKFPGHTEFLANAFNVKEALMFMVSDQLRVGVLTGHIPLEKVKDHIKSDALRSKILQMLRSLKNDFGKARPRLAVLGLNPHAGENGLLGSEEKEIIHPVIEEFRTKGEFVYGPFPSDGFFASGGYKKFDGVLAMYHDQGLIPFKTIAFHEGVNFTAGLPVVRTSPDHGTAYDIAGKNMADPASLLQAIYLAIDVAQMRSEAKEITRNALRPKPHLNQQSRGNKEDKAPKETMGKEELS